MLHDFCPGPLGVEPGEYNHFAASLHLYDDKAAEAEAFIREGIQGREGADMPPMPDGNPWPDIRVFLSAEAAIRAGLPMPEEVGRLNPYWRDLVNLLRVFRHYKFGEKDRISGIKDEMSNHFYKEYIEMKEGAGQ
jgi:thymidylate synthase